MIAPQFWIVSASFGQGAAGQLMIGSTVSYTEIEAATVVISRFLQQSGCKEPLNVVATRTFTREELAQILSDIDAATKVSKTGGSILHLIKDAQSAPSTEDDPNAA